MKHAEGIPQNVIEQAKRAEALISGDTPQDDPQKGEREGASSHQDKNENEWEQRYRVLQGKYDAEVPRLSVQIAELQEQLTELVSEKEQLQEKLQEQASKQQGLDPGEYEDFGEEMKKLVETVNDLRAENLKLQSELNRLKSDSEQVKNVQVKTAQELFFERLTQQCPDWAKINEDTRFLTWLAEVDELSGTPRQAHLDNAHRRGDAVTVARIFNTWARLAGLRNSEEQITQPTPASQVPPANIQPGSSRGGAGDAAAHGKIYTRAEVKEHYDSQARGEWRGREDEWARIEADMLKAAAEGRIR